jgi:hypothetical protein
MRGIPPTFISLIALHGGRIIMSPNTEDSTPGRVISCFPSYLYHPENKKKYNSIIKTNACIAKQKQKIYKSYNTTVSILPEHNSIHPT